MPLWHVALKITSQDCTEHIEQWEYSQPQSPGSALESVIHMGYDEEEENQCLRKHPDSVSVFKAFSKKFPESNDSFLK